MHVPAGWEKPWVEQIVDRIMKGTLKTTEERAKGVVRVDNSSSSSSSSCRYKGSMSLLQQPALSKQHNMQAAACCPERVHNQPLQQHAWATLCGKQP